MGKLEDLHHELTAFFDFGSLTKLTSQTIEDGTAIPVYENEFWTAKQRAGHSIHEVSYRACYKPQLPAFFIQRFCQKNDRVYDPFMGRGTTLVEAQLHHCQAVGNDANPLSQILIAPRLNPPSLADIEARLAQIDLPQEGLGEVDPELHTFFHPQTLQELYGWRLYFRNRLQNGQLDQCDAWIRMVAINRLTGHSAGFFSVYTLPPNQATSLQAQKRINEKRSQAPDYRETKSRILKKSKQLLKDPLPKSFPRSDALLLNHSADLTQEIASASVQLIVTSPPFLDIVDYVGDNWLRNWFCETAVNKDLIWQMGSIEQWIEKMTHTFRELKRLLKSDGIIAFEVGEVRKGKVRLEDQVILAAKKAGLIPELILINTQDFTKTANLWGVDNNKKGTNSNRIVLLRK